MAPGIRTLKERSSFQLEKKVAHQPSAGKSTASLTEHELCLLAKHLLFLFRYCMELNGAAICRASAGAANTANGSHANSYGGSFSYSQKGNPLRLGLVPPQPLDGKTEKQAYQRELHTVTVGELLV